MKAQCAKEREAPTARSQTLALRAPKKSDGHTSESCPELQPACKNRANWCSSPATRADSYRPPHRCRDADKTKRARLDTAAAQKAKRESRLPPERIRRQGPQSRPRRWRPKENSQRLNLSR